jgi:hypothetical protein
MGIHFAHKGLPFFIGAELNAKHLASVSAVRRKRPAAFAVGSVGEKP